MLNDEYTKYYQSSIVILRWIVEKGRIDVCIEVSVMLSFITTPRYGNLIQVLYIFVYLKCHHLTRLVFDQSYLDVIQNDFPRKYWSEFY